MWQVKWRRGGGAAEGDLVIEALLTIIEGEGAKRIAAMRPTIGSREGVVEEAERELRKAGRHSPPARRLLSRINSWRRPGS